MFAYLFFRSVPVKMHLFLLLLKQYFWDKVYCEHAHCDPTVMNWKRAIKLRQIDYAWQPFSLNALLPLQSIVL